MVQSIRSKISLFWLDGMVDQSESCIERTFEFGHLTCEFRMVYSVKWLDDWLYTVLCEWVYDLQNTFTLNFYQLLQIGFCDNQGFNKLYSDIKVLKSNFGSSAINLCKYYHLIDFEASLDISVFLGADLFVFKRNQEPTD